MLKRHKRETEVIIALEKFETLNDGKLFSKLCQISCPFQLSRLLVRREKLRRRKLAIFALTTCTRARGLSQG